MAVPQTWIFHPDGEPVGRIPLPFNPYRLDDVRSDFSQLLKYLSPAFRKPFTPPLSEGHMIRPSFLGVIFILGLLISGLPPRQDLFAQSVDTFHAQPIQSRFFTTSDGVRLHYLEAGTGPALIFVPGWTMPAEIWEAQLRDLSREFRVIALDPRSQGASE